MKKILLICILTFIVMFVGINAKACSCYYRFSQTYSDVSSYTMVNAFYVVEMAYTSSSADVIGSCVMEWNSNSYNPDELVNKCSTNSNPISRGNPFDVRPDIIASADCSVSACQNANLFLNVKNNEYSVTTKGSYQFSAIGVDEYRKLFSINTIEDVDGAAGEEPKQHKRNSFNAWDAFQINTPTGCDVIGSNVMAWIQNILKIFRYVAPILVVALGSLDFIKGIASGDDNAVKKALQTFGKRLIAVVLLFLLPAIINLLLIWLNGAYKGEYDCAL